jgi:plasmid stabilization system protein ParE
MPDRYRAIFSKEAAAHLQSTSDSISKDSLDNAPRVIAEILESIDLLEIFPHRNVLPGRNARLKRPVRTLPAGSYIVFFRIIEEERVVRISRIQHGARRRPKRFE